MTTQLEQTFTVAAEAGPPPRIDAYGILRGARRRQHRRRAAMTGGVAVLAVGAVGGATLVPAMLGSDRPNRVATLSDGAGPAYQGHRLPAVVRGEPVRLGQDITDVGPSWTAHVDVESSSGPARRYPTVTATDDLTGATITMSSVQVEPAKPDVPVCLRNDRGQRIAIGVDTQDPTYAEVIFAGHRLAVHATRVGGAYTLLWAEVPDGVAAVGAPELVLGTVDPSSGRVSVRTSLLDITLRVVGGRHPVQILGC